MVDIFIAIFLILDFVISIWNSYAAGFSLGLLKISKGPGWFRTFAVLGLAMGLLGEAYVIAIFLALSDGQSAPVTVVLELTIFQLGSALARTLFVPAMASQAMIVPALLVLACRDAAGQ